MEELRPYQERAVQEIVKAIEAGEGKFLQLHMGFGKTRCVLEALRRSEKNAFVFAPLLVAQQTWIKEIYKWNFDFTWSVIHGAHKHLAIESGVDILIAPYSSMKWIYEYGQKHGGGFLRGRTLVCDESTAFKRADSKRFGMLQGMQCLCRNGVLCLSGRPNPEGYMGLWSQYWMLDRGAALGRTISSFKRTYFTYDEYRYKYSLIAGADTVIQQKVAPLTVALNNDEEMQLPEAFYETIDVKMPEDANKIYREMQQNSAVRMVEECPTGDLTSDILAENAGAKLNKLRQIAQGFIYSYQTWHLHTAKVDMLKAIVEAANDDPVLVAIYYRAEIEILERAFERVLPVIAGGVSSKRKGELLTSWDKGEIPLLLVHPASLSHGVNMQYGGHVLIWYSLPWSLEQYVQLNARLIRPGQSKPVRIFHLSSLGTVDAYVARVLEMKEATAEEFNKALIAATMGGYNVETTDEKQPADDGNLLDRSTLGDEVLGV